MDDPVHGCVWLFIVISEAVFGNGLSQNELVVEPTPALAPPFCEFDDGVSSDRAGTVCVMI